MSGVGGAANNVGGAANNVGGIGVGETGVTGRTDVTRVFGLTKAVYNSTLVTTISAINTLYDINAVSVSLGTITNITDNNDGSFTNTSGSSAVIHGIVFVNGGNATAKNFNVQAVVDNTGSKVAVLSNSGGQTANAVTSSQIAYIYTTQLGAGKTVSLQIANRSDSGNFTLTNLSHMVWN